MRVIKCATIACVVAFAPVYSASAQDGEDGGKVCNAADVQGMLGKRWIKPMERKIRRETNSNTLRLLKPGMQTSQEYREDRVNVILSYQEGIDQIFCG